MSPHIKRLIAGGLRGLSSEQTVHFAIPNGEPGSGLTMLLGSNNSGKSTIVEALRLLGHRQKSSLSEGRRNRAYGDQVRLTLECTDGSARSLMSVRPGGSETVWEYSDPSPPDLFVVPSRRTFAAYFGGQGRQELDDRSNYTHLWAPTALKSATVDQFTTRLFRVNRDEDTKAKFDAMLREVVNPLPNWTIDQTDEGKYYLKFVWGDETGAGVHRHTHSSDGLGEGVISLFFIIDSLYDSEPGSMTVIDEPELSLHPQFQRRLQSVISRLSADRQIVYATHSPYFISWPDIARGAGVVRVYKTVSGTQVALPQRETLEATARLASGDTHNPHVLGLDAAEVFFLEDGVILVEGQEDVVYIPRVLAQLGLTLEASYFGWGVGGASKMSVIARLLQEMGYVRVLGLLDNDHEATARGLQRTYPDFQFECIPADDVRYKPPRKAFAGKLGLIDEAGILRPEHASATRELFQRAKSYFESHGPSSIV